MNKKINEKKTTLFEIEEDKQNKEDLAKEEKEKEEIKEKEEEKEKKEKEKKEKEEKLNKLKEQENKKKQAEQELLLRLQENEDPNYLIFEFNIENIELSLMKSISLKERKILSQIDPKTIEDLKLDTKYRDFIVFSLNQFKIDVLTTEKGNMNVTISMESTSIKDKETIIISKDNPKGDILINKEFQDLIHMRAEERRRPPKELRNFLKKRSEIYGIQTVKEDDIENKSYNSEENDKNKLKEDEYIKKSKELKERQMVLIKKYLTFKFREKFSMVSKHTKKTKKDNLEFPFDIIKYNKSFPIKIKTKEDLSNYLILSNSEFKHFNSYDLIKRVMAPEILPKLNSSNNTNINSDNLSINSELTKDNSKKSIGKKERILKNIDGIKIPLFLDDIIDIEQNIKQYLKPIDNLLLRNLSLITHIYLVACGKEDIKSSDIGMSTMISDNRQGFKSPNKNSNNQNIHEPKKIILEEQPYIEEQKQEQELKDQKEKEELERIRKEQELKDQKEKEELERIRKEQELKRKN